jgi:hypothetical protein
MADSGSVNTQLGRRVQPWAYKSVTGDFSCQPVQATQQVRQQQPGVDSG